LIERVTQYFVTVRLVLRVTQYVVTSQIFVTGKIYTLVSGCQPHTIQILCAHARDLTMAAAGHAYGLAPVCDRYKIIIINMAKQKRD